MDEDKRKYLEFIQNIITRMNSNSFMIKGWAITLVSALLVLFATVKVDSLYIITILPIFIFWALDAQYLQMERKFRSLYNKAIANPPTVSLYNMNINESSIKNDLDNKYWSVFRSNTLLPFYLLLMLITGGLCVFFTTKKDDKKKETLNVSIQDTIRIKGTDPGNFIQNDTVYLKAKSK